MTNKEAIRVLEQIKEHPTLEVYLPHEYEALDLAIKALERDGTIAFEDDEPTVCTCPVCGSIWKTVETNKSETWN